MIKDKERIIQLEKENKQLKENFIILLNGLKDARRALAYISCADCGDTVEENDTRQQIIKCAEDAEEIAGEILKKIENI